MLGPRLVVAAPTSGAGKTTFTTGLLAALARSGVRVAGAKVGPDFIDPGYHGLATGRPGRNLDAWISGPASIAPLAATAAEGADLLVVEGVMGLFDGAAWVPAELSGAAPDDPRVGFASTAHVAALLDAPVLLVLDAAATSSSAAAVVHGFATWVPSVRLGGVVLNRVGSDRHETLLRDALAATGVPVLGAVRRDSDITWPDRHLGLVPVVERRAEAAATIDRLAANVAAGCDLAAIVQLAGCAPGRPTAPLLTARPAGRARVAVAAGSAFSFTYPDNLERLAEAGAELVPVDPLTDRALPPDVDGLVVGGGFPEVHAEALADNVPLLADVGRRVREGLVTWAECGGLLWLGQALEGRPMVGVVPTEAALTSRLTLGYRRATVTVDTPVAPAGAGLRGHVFHYSATEPAGAALVLQGRDGAQPEGFAGDGLLASYLHLHLGADPTPAERFVAACDRRRRAAAGLRE